MVYFLYVSIVVKNKEIVYLMVPGDGEILVKRDVKNFRIRNSISLRNRNEGAVIIKGLPY